MSAGLEQAISSLEQVQQLDARIVGRSETLGSTFELTGAVPPLTRAIDLFREVPASALQEFGESQRSLIQGQAESIIRMYGRLMGFDPAVDNAAQQRASLLTEATNTFDGVFSALYPIIAYLNARKLDSSETTKAVEDALTQLRQLSEEGARSVSALEAEASRVLAEVRRTAAESGVSQQANYFGAESERHEQLATKWQKHTIQSAVALGFFALISLALSLVWPTTDAYQAAQIAFSKVLIFSTVAFMLFLSSRTLLAHRHNAVVNKHRQNALLTFNALAEATGDGQTREVILTHASACIYAPQETGFGKSSGNLSSSPTIDVMPRIMGQQIHA